MPFDNLKIYRNFHVKTIKQNLSIKTFFTIKLERNMNQNYEFEN